MKHPAVILALLFVACGEGRTPPPARIGHRIAPPDNSLLDENKRMAEREENDIRDWVERQGVPMVSTGTGLRF